MRIAIADDEESIREFTADLLIANGHVCSAFRNGPDLVRALQRDTFDLVILDWAMPGMSGLEVVSWAREKLDPRPPFIMLTCRNDKTDIVNALNAGADDYIIKPESREVISARVEALLRRTVPAENRERVESHDGYDFDRLTSSVTFDGLETPLTAREFNLALMFFRQPHRAFSRAYILETLWHSTADLSTRTLDMHISRIRSKLKLGPERGYRLQTIFGYGYRLERFVGD